MNKKIYIMFFSIMSLLSFFCTWKYLSESESTKQISYLSNNSYQLLKYDSISKNSDFIEEIQKISKKENVNIFYFDYEDSTEPTIYLQINKDNKKIKSILNLTNSYTTNRVTSINKTNSFQYKELKKLEKNNSEIKGNFLLKGSYKSVRKFVEELNLRYRGNTYSKETYYVNKLSLDFILVIIIEIMISMMLIIYFIFNIFKNYKKFTLLAFLGYSKRKIFLILNKKIFLICILSNLISNIIFYFIFFEINKIIAILNFCTFFISVIVAIILCVLIINFHVPNYKDLGEKIKSEKIYKFISKFAISFSLVFIIAISFYIPNIQNVILEKMKQNEINEKLTNYTHSYITKEIDSNNDKQAFHEILMTNKLLKYYFQRGILIFETSDNETNIGKYTEDNYSDNEIITNSEYLNFCEIKDLKGNTIKINNSSDKMIELVPEFYNLKKIKKYIKEDHEFIDTEVGNEKNVSKKKYKASKIKIIRIKNNQNLFLPTTASQTLSNPIIRIITPNNTSPVSAYADNILTNDSAFYVKKDNKYRIGNNYDIDPYHYLDYYTKGVDANHYLETNNNEIYGTVKSLLITFCLILFAYISLFIFTIVLYYISYQKKIKITILLGYSKFFEIKKILFTLFFPWIIGFLYSIYIQNIYIFMVQSIIIGGLIGISAIIIELKKL